MGTSMKSFKQLREVTIKLKGFNSDNSAKAKNADFTRELHDTTEPHPFNHNARIIGNAHVHVSSSSSGIHIHDIKSHTQGSGAGTDALKHLTSLADKHKVKLSLNAVGYSNTSSKRLHGWYSKHGFVSSPSNKDHMIRNPQ